MLSGLGNGQIGHTGARQRRVARLSFRSCSYVVNAPMDATIPSIGALASPSQVRARERRIGRSALRAILKGP